MDSAGSRYTNLISNNDVDDEHVDEYVDEYNRQDTTQWDDDEEIELESDEHELFLCNEYVKPQSNNVLPYKATNFIMNKSHIRNGLTRNNYPKRNGQISNPTSLVNNSCNDSTRVETFQVDDSGFDSSTPSSVAYQIPNYDQFAGNLAPSSPYSVLISFIIIFVILAVTIVPKIIPESQPSDEDFVDGDLSESSTTKIAQIPYQSVHLDARCKCICPPLLKQKTEDNANSTINSSDKRRLYVGNTSPDQCNCNNIVQPHFKEESSKLSLREFCVRCECRYQSRNTTTIKRNIVFFIAVLVGLSLYLIIQYLLKHLRLTRRSLPPNLRWMSHQMNEDD